MVDEHRALVAHLFRRAGFGARQADLDAYATKAYRVAVEDLIHPPSSRRHQPNAAAQSTGEPLRQPQLGKMQESWLQDMVGSQEPLVERMTLFLSNHFATAYAPDLHVDAAALAGQHEKLRKFALGSFADLAHAMIDDKALACYLNNDKNNRAKPNENLARELMELFLLGPGHYSEQDVKETARALTGYTLQSTPGMRPSLVYKKQLHDEGPKTILGVTANFAPHDVVDLFLSQPAARLFLANKLVAHFVGSPADASLAGSVADGLHPRWNLTDALRTVFYSRQFQSADARQSLAKTPAEYVAGIMRALGRAEYAEGVSYMNATGQILFRPPSVAGWALGKRMLGPGSMLARYNAAARFAELHRSRPASGLPQDTQVDSWMEAFGMTSLSAATNDALNGYLNSTKQQPTPTRTAGLITLLVASSDFNLS